MLNYDDRGRTYRWVGQSQVIVYIGKIGNWHRFSTIEDLEAVWCEVLDSDLDMIEAC